MIRRIRLPLPGRHQLPILLSRARFKVGDCGRRFGKTLLGMHACIIGHGPVDAPFLGALNGGNIWWVAPSYGVASKIWRDIKTALRGWPDLIKNEIERRVEFPSGGAISVKSAHDPDSLRGEGLDGVVIDEAAFCAEETWTLALRPALADRQGWAIFISSPNGKNWFWRMWEKGGIEDGWEAWQLPTSLNPFIAPGELEQARESLGSFAYSREFEAKFVTADAGKMFKRETIRRYTPEDLAKCAVVSRFVTADLAVSTKTWADYTAAFLWARVADGRLFVLDCFHDRVDGAVLVPKLAALVTRWGAGKLVLEGGGTLATLNTMARAAGLPVSEHAYGGKDKREKATPLAAAFEAGRVLLPQEAPWLKLASDQGWTGVLDELEDFPDPSSHDDCVDALALGVATAPSLFKDRKPVDRRPRVSNPQKSTWFFGRG